MPKLHPASPQGACRTLPLGFGAALVVAASLATGRAAAQTPADYPGVHASGTGSTPQLDRAQKRQGAVVTWVGLERYGAAPVLFLQSTGALQIGKAKSSPSEDGLHRHRYAIAGASTHLKNTSRAVVIAHPDSPLRRVKLSRNGRGLQLDVISRSATAPSFSHQAQSKASKLWVSATDAIASDSAAFGTAPVPTSPDTLGAAPATTPGAAASETTEPTAPGRSTAGTRALGTSSYNSGARFSPSERSKAPPVSQVPSLTPEEGSLRVSLAPDPRRLLDSTTGAVGRRRGFGLDRLQSGNRTETRVGASIEIAGTPTEAIEVGGLVVPLLLSPSFQFEDMEFYSRLRMARTEKLELVGQVAVRVGNRNNWGLQGGIEGRYALTDQLAVDFGVSLEERFADDELRVEGGFIIEEEDVTGFFTPIALLFFPTEATHVGLHTAFATYEFDSYAAPLGLIAGHRLNIAPYKDLGFNIAVSAPRFYTDQQGISFDFLQVYGGVAFHWGIRSERLEEGYISSDDASEVQYEAYGDEPEQPEPSQPVRRKKSVTVQVKRAVDAEAPPAVSPGYDSFNDEELPPSMQ